MSKIEFWKMNGAGNDFVVLDNRDHRYALSAEQIARLCDRHRGIGADGLLAVEPSQNGGDFRMRYYNADGGEAEMCGNGARCFARFVNLLHDWKLDHVSFETQAGIIGASYHGANVRLLMSEPHSLHLGEHLDVAGQQLTVHSLNTGVPHAVVIVDDLNAVRVKDWGSVLRHHDHFQPKGTNVNFVQVLAPGSLAIRTYERGVEDETLACGTGMVACALIHNALHPEVAGPVKVRVKGGDTLEVGFLRDGEDDWDQVTLTGPADLVFSGTLEL